MGTAVADATGDDGGATGGTGGGALVGLGGPPAIWGGPAGGAATDGRDMTGGGGAPCPARAAGDIVDGRANGAGIAGSCVGLGGALTGDIGGGACAGTGITGRTGVDWRAGVGGVTGGAAGCEIAGVPEPTALGRACVAAGAVGVGIDTLGVGIDTLGVGVDMLGVGIDTLGVVGALRGGSGATGVARATDGAKSVRASRPAAMVITPPQTEHRARTLAEGIFEGSTRNSDRHSGHATFMRRLPRERPSSVP